MYTRAWRSSFNFILLLSSSHKKKRFVDNSESDMVRFCPDLRLLPSVFKPASLSEAVFQNVWMFLISFGVEKFQA